MKCCRQHYIDSSLGFTLVEIMITIGVVAILTSMAVPTVKIYTERLGRWSVRPR
jgi:prepilin-type N-terminal cleavage/methylation domain-containing protein